MAISCEVFNKQKEWKQYNASNIWKCIFLTFFTWTNSPYEYTYTTETYYIRYARRIQTLQLQSVFKIINIHPICQHEWSGGTVAARSTANPGDRVWNRGCFSVRLEVQRWFIQTLVKGFCLCCRIKWLKGLFGKR